eukprot:TRINITY_DN1996_c0_g1_i3.p1 TRINITY_DN1996_c0_g1~~TRINITY_DN1996_c0_g1_i3.p1  ORF type:complete len:139 (-),score=20.41 TRINITY_DN1996_c0_g1_i3:41-457(-)
MKAVVGAPTAADDEFTIPEDAPCPFSFSASASSGHQDDATRALIANGLVDVMQFRTHAQIPAGYKDKNFANVPEPGNNAYSAANPPPNPFTGSFASMKIAWIAQSYVRKLVRKHGGHQGAEIGTFAVGNPPFEDTLQL